MACLKKKMPDLRKSRAFRPRDFLLLEKPIGMILAYIVLDMEILEEDFAEMEG